MHRSWQPLKALTLAEIVHWREFQNQLDFQLSFKLISVISKSRNQLIAWEIHLI